MALCYSTVHILFEALVTVLLLLDHHLSAIYKNHTILHLESVTYSDSLAIMIQKSVKKLGLQN